MDHINHISGLKKKSGGGAEGVVGEALSAYSMS